LASGVEIDQPIAAAATGLRHNYGIIVVARAAGAAAEVPLQVRDIIRSLNKRPTVSLAGFRDMLESVKPGSPVTLQIQREGRLRYLSFTLE